MCVYVYMYTSSAQLQKATKVYSVSALLIIEVKLDLDESFEVP